MVAPRKPRNWMTLSEAQRRSVRLEYAVDQTVLKCLLSGEEAVALHVFADLLLGETCVFGVDLIEALAHVEDLAGVDLDVGRLTFEACRGLMDEDARVGQGSPLALRASGQ